MYLVFKKKVNEKKKMLKGDRTQENICIPCIHTQHQITTTLANAAIS